MNYYKVTRPDGSSFYDPDIKYVVGKRVRPKPYDGKRELCGPGVLHASKTIRDAYKTASWPCAVFKVTGKPIVEQSDKSGFKQLHVVEQIPSMELFGPNGDRVQAVLDRVAVCTVDEICDLGAAWDAAWGAARGAAWGAAWDAAWGAVWDAAWGAAWDAAWGAARGAAWGAAWDAALHDLIGQHGYTQEHSDLLTQPWREVIGVWNPDTEKWDKETV